MKNKFLGKVAVDTGQLIIIDPVNLGHWNPDKDYPACCDISDNPDHAGIIGNVGLVISGFGGDGLYDVFADTDKFGKIRELRIKFNSSSD